MKKVFLSLLFIFTFITIAESYDNTVVHKVINTNAAKQSNNLLKFLVELGFESGLESSVNGQKIYKWFEDGGKAEDEPVTRTLNHFHDPTKAWSEAGLNDSITIFGIPIITFKGESSVLWMQQSEQNAGGGTWSWPKARDYYYMGLTAKSKEAREQNLADTFKALGHIMHLVSDVSVPAHVRNDAHPGGDPYETYTEQAKTLQYSGYATVTFPKLTDYWDDENGKGLAEFTNTNFFSKDRNKDNIYYTNPKVLAEDKGFLQEVTDADDNKEIVEVKYGLGTVTDSYANTSYTDVKLTAYSFWDFDYKQKTNKRIYFLNDTIHQTYADFLIPRAVGYSAGLLNYFFRGDIDMIPDGESGSGYVIVNNTDEDMNGAFELWYDNKNDERLKVSGASWALNINKKDPNNSNANKSTNVTFTAPTDMKESGKYMLVFRGKLGSEENAVVGKRVYLLPPLVFLIYQDAQNNPVYAVLAIENNGKKLASYNFDISKYATYFNIYNYKNPSVVKSDDNYQNHVYTVENLIIDNIQPQYGKKMRYDNSKDILVGVRNSFIKGAFDFSTGYSEYNDDYICSGRNSAYIDTDGREIENLELWKIDNTHGQIKYKVDGDVRNGAVVDFQDKSDIYAVLDKNGAVVKNEKCSSYNNSSNGNTILSYPYFRGDIIIDICVRVGFFTSHIVTNPKKAIFIDTILEEDIGQVSHTSFDSISWKQVPHACTEPTVECIGYWYLRKPGGIIEGIYISYLQSAADVIFLDYDNAKDGNFILFYKLSQNRDYDFRGKGSVGNSGYDQLGICATQASGPNTYGGIFYRGVVVNEYKLAYKIGNDFKKVIIGTEISANSKTTDEETTYNIMEGSRISNVSSYVSKQFIFYTYTLEDILDGVWTFKKRILGVINITSGERNEFEVNDDVLGQYKNSFDKTLPSAIGFHSGSINK